MPTTTPQSTALNGINTTITNFVSTANQKGASLQASDLAPYVDPNYLDNGENASKWETRVASDLAGLSLTFSGLQINSLDTSTNIADVTFQMTQTQNNVTSSQPVETNFKPISGTWVIAGNNRIADAYAQTWAWYQPSSPNNGSYAYSNSLRIGVNDPRQNNVQSVTVSGLGVTGTLSQTGTVTVPLVCSYNSADCNNGACPTCGNSHGDSTKKAFELDISGWPSPSLDVHVHPHRGERDPCLHLYGHHRLRFRWERQPRPRRLSLDDVYRGQPFLGPDHGGQDPDGVGLCPCLDPGHTGCAPLQL